MLALEIQAGREEPRLTAMEEHATWVYGFALWGHGSRIQVLALATEFGVCAALCNLAPKALLVTNRLLSPSNR